MSVIPDFHRLNKSRTVEMSKEELNSKLREEAARSRRYAQKNKRNDNSRRQQKIAAQTRKQLPPQSPARRKREEEARRLAEQEMREQRRRKRGGSNIVYYVMLSVLAVIIFAVLSVTVLFNTEKIIIEGESDYTEEQILAASGLNGDENLVRLNTAEIPAKMLDRLVKLDSVKIDKVFPSTIKITVERSVPMANFLYNDRSYLISHIGRVMAIDNEDPGCMTVIGYKPVDSIILGGFIKAADEEQDKLVREITDAIEKAGINDITTVDITDNLAIHLSYEDRVQINLGSILQIDEKMRIIRELLFNGHIAETEFVTLDVSDTSRAIQRPITTAAITAEPVTEEETEGDEPGDEAEQGGESTEEPDAAGDGSEL